MAWSIPGAGAMRERVSIVRTAQVPDCMGGWTSATTVIASGLPARISPMKGLEQVISQGLNAVATDVIIIRSSVLARSLTGADQLVNDRTGQAYNVRWVSNPDERNRYLQIYVETGVAGS